MPHILEAVCIPSETRSPPSQCPPPWCNVVSSGDLGLGVPVLPLCNQRLPATLCSLCYLHCLYQVPPQWVRCGGRVKRLWLCLLSSNGASLLPPNCCATSQVGMLLLLLWPSSMLHEGWSLTPFSTPLSAESAASLPPLLILISPPSHGSKWGSQTRSGVVQGILCWITVAQFVVILRGDTKESSHSPMMLMLGLV